MTKYDTKTNEIEFTPTVNTEYGIELLKGEVKEKVMNDFKKRSASIQDGSWRDGWHRFCVENAQRYINGVKDNDPDETGEIGNNIFAHYLDCEAHTDVWRELFKTANHRNER